MAAKKRKRDGITKETKSRPRQAAGYPSETVVKTIPRQGLRGRWENICHRAEYIRDAKTQGHYDEASGPNPGNDFGDNPVPGDRKKER